MDFIHDHGIPITPRGGLEADPVTLQTPVEWVFVGGDAYYGPKSVVDAVGWVQEQYADRKICLAGFSLGGNFALRVAAEATDANLSLDRKLDIIGVLMALMLVQIRKLQ